MTSPSSILWLTLLLIAVPASAQEDADHEALTEHQRMEALLADIASRVDEENGFLGDGPTQRVRDALANDELSLSTQWELHSYLGRHELGMGRIDEALKHWTACHRLIPSQPAQVRTRRTEVTVLNLGMSYLRQAETENCIAMHTSDSCIFPIGGQGVHQNQDGSRQAMRWLRQLVRRSPMGSRSQVVGSWLLNVAAMTVGDYPDEVPRKHLIPPERFDSDQEFPRFVDVAPELGLNVLNLSGGAAIDDFDGDGDLDVVTTTWNPREPMHFHRNNGDGTFTDVTEEAGLSGMLGGLNLTHADYDNDGDLDLLVLRGAWFQEYGQHPNSLLSNDGKGHFQDVTMSAGLGAVHYPTQTASFADMDHDGDLDLYIGNEATDTLAFPCQLFVNQGDGTFVERAEAAGVTNDLYTKGVMWGDFDGDRWPDLYVSNLRAENRLYRNLGDGTFEDVAPELGLVEPKSSFPTWFFDHDNDGLQDIFVASYVEDVAWVVATYLGHEVGDQRCRLYRNLGGGRFEERGIEAGLTRNVAVMGTNFGDLDNDGFLDFYLGTGFPDISALMPNIMYRNVGGRTFADVTTAGGFGHLQKGHGVAFADLDRDGDQDVFEQMGGAYESDRFGNALYENPGFGNRWLNVRLVGTTSNRWGIGARIRVELIENEQSRSVYRWVNSGGSFGSGPLAPTIGLGQATRIERLEVYWPTTDRTQSFGGVEMDRFVTITEDEEELRTEVRAPIPFQK